LTAFTLSNFLFSLGSFAHRIPQASLEAS
jgi:hypothetical protein